MSGFPSAKLLNEPDEPLGGLPVAPVPALGVRCAPAPGMPVPAMTPGPGRLLAQRSR